MNKHLLNVYQNTSYNTCCHILGISYWLILQLILTYFAIPKDVSSIYLLEVKAASS